MPDKPELADVESMAVDAIQGLVSGPSLIATKLTGLDDARDDLVADPVGALGSVAEDAVEMVTHPADAVEAAADLAGAVAENIATTAEDVATGAADAAEWTVDTAEDAVEGAAWVVTHPEQAIVDAGEAIIGEAGHLTGGVVSDIADEAGAVLEDVDEATGNIVSDTYETISDGVTDAADEVGALFGGRREPAEDRTRDSDSDGVTDWDERNVHGTDPLRWDTDGDGLADGRELREYGTDPTAGDSDSDGLADGEELRRDTDPFSWDTDGDGWSDGMEARFTNTDPLRQDTDRDGLTDRDEGMVHRTDPNERDSDGDGLRDGREVERGYDANAADTDGDGTGDGAELAFEDGTWMDGEASDFDAAEETTLEAVAGDVIENDGVVEYGTDPSDLDAVDLAVGGHDPLPVAGTLDDAQSSLAEPAPTMQTFGGDTEGRLVVPGSNGPNLNDPNTWPTLADAVTTTVDETPTEAMRPSPIEDAVTTTPDEALPTVELPPSPIDEAVSSWEADTPTELLPPSPIDDIDLDGLAGFGDPFTEAPVVDDNVGDAVSPFEPGGLDTELDFGG